MHAARAARLRYVSDSQPGISRRAVAAGFSYRDTRGRVIRNAAELARIKALAVPPAWTGVWICPLENGHLQATGRDARRRKQYRYHRRWRQARDETKYEHMLEFGRGLRAIRRRIAADLGLPGLPRAKVLAAVVRLMEDTLARVGNPEYAAQNNTFGLTTLRSRLPQRHSAPNARGSWQRGAAAGDVAHRADRHALSCRAAGRHVVTMLQLVRESDDPDVGLAIVPRAARRLSGRMIRMAAREIQMLSIRAQPGFDLRDRRIGPPREAQAADQRICR